MAAPTLDHYGRQFGAQHKSALHSFSETMWLTDSVESLRVLLRQPKFLKRFQEFVAMDPGVGEELNFYLRTRDLTEPEPLPKPKARLAMATRARRASRDGSTLAACALYDEYFGSARNGIGQQERTKSTQQLWNTTKTAKPRKLDPYEVRACSE